MEAFISMIETAIDGATHPVMIGIYLAASAFVVPLVPALAARMVTIGLDPND
jgi:hypothetical protein